MLKLTKGFSEKWNSQFKKEWLFCAQLSQLSVFVRLLNCIIYQPHVDLPWNNGIYPICFQLVSSIERTPIYVIVTIAKEVEICHIMQIHHISK